MDEEEANRRYCNKLKLTTFTAISHSLSNNKLVTFCNISNHHGG